jgi:hypothetical protein
MGCHAKPLGIVTRVTNLLQWQRDCLVTNYHITVVIFACHCVYLIATTELATTLDRMLYNVIQVVLLIGTTFITILAIT